MIWETEPSASYPFDEILFFLFEILVPCPPCPMEDADQRREDHVLVLVVRRGGGEGMLWHLLWAKLWSGWAAVCAMVGLACMIQNQEVAVKEQAQKVANGHFPVSALILCSASEFECQKIKAKAGLC